MSNERKTVSGIPNYTTPITTVMETDRGQDLGYKFDYGASGSVNFQKTSHRVTAPDSRLQVPSMEAFAGVERA